MLNPQYEKFSSNRSIATKLTNHHQQVIRLLLKIRLLFMVHLLIRGMNNTIGNTLVTADISHKTGWRNELGESGAGGFPFQIVFIVS